MSPFAYSEREIASDSENEQHSSTLLGFSSRFSKRNYRQRSQSDSSQSNHALETMEIETENENENDNENETTDRSDSESSDEVKSIR